MIADNNVSATSHPRGRRGMANPAMFFRRWLAIPLQMRSVVRPSGLCAVGSRGTRSVPGMRRCRSWGRGPGWSQGRLLDGGVPSERWIVVEIVPEMANHLRGVLPDVLVIEGDARELPRLLPRHWHGRIGSVVCGIPLVWCRWPSRRGSSLRSTRLPQPAVFFTTPIAPPRPLPRRRQPGAAAGGLDTAQRPAGKRVALRSRRVADR
jgi:phospholipid N-methyltransferase